MARNTWGDNPNEGGGGGGGTSDYEDLDNLPSINGVTIEGDLTSDDLGLATEEQGAKADTAVQQVTVGTTITGEAGTNASVTNSGTSTAPVLDFTIPRGATGATGERGPQGFQGPQGNPGSSVDYPFTLANNLTTDDSTKGLAAPMGVELRSRIDRHEYSKLNKAPGINLYDESEKLASTKLNSNGTTSSSSGWLTSPFILVSPGTDYCLHRLSGDARAALDNRSYICFYDSAFNFISYLTSNTLTFTTPATSSYLRFGSPNSGATKIQLELGTTPSGYVEYDAAYGYTGTIKENLTNKVDISLGANLFDKKTIAAGYITSAGLVNVKSYKHSSFIKVKPQTSYYVSAKGDSTPCSSTNAYHAFYDSNKEYISGSSVVATTKLLTSPAGAAYLRITINDNKEEVSVAEGTSRPTYQEYSEIAGYLPIIREKQVEYWHLNDAIREKLGGSNSFMRMHDSATLAVNGSLTLGTCHIGKNTIISAKIDGTIDRVCVGYGMTDGHYGGKWVEIHQTTVNLWQYGSSASEMEVYTHGLTLTQHTTVEIHSVRNGLTETTVLRLMNDIGDVFEQVLPSWGKGRPFAKNANSSGSVDIDLSFYPRDLSGRIWLFGDSYVTCDNQARWPYYLANAGMDKWLMNSYPGQQPTNAYNDLLSLLSLGAIPTYIVWTLGMNGGNDTGSGGEYTINADQKTTLDNVIDICSEYGITPILATIPTVPTRQKTGFCDYVRSLGVRYIDFADAVGTDSAGAWNTGLLSSDGVHPTQAGAKVLAARALQDFPEFSIILQ